MLLICVKNVYLTRDTDKCTNKITTAVLALSVVWLPTPIVANCRLETTKFTKYEL
jgi:hypothetical protein